MPTTIKICNQPVQIDRVDIPRNCQTNRRINLANANANARNQKVETKNEMMIFLHACFGTKAETVEKKRSKINKSKPKSREKKQCPTWSAPCAIRMCGFIAYKWRPRQRPHRAHQVVVSRCGIMRQIVVGPRLSLVGQWRNKSKSNYALIAYRRNARLGGWPRRLRSYKQPGWGKASHDCNTCLLASPTDNTIVYLKW